jgi:hypothetical protein
MNGSDHPARCSAASRWLDAVRAAAACTIKVDIGVAGGVSQGLPAATLTSLRGFAALQQRMVSG